MVLTDEERDTLQRWARRPKSAQALAQRCRIVLGCAAGKSNKEVAAELGVSQQMVCKWRGRFVARPVKRAGRRSAPRCSARDRRRADRGGGGGHAGTPAPGRDALVADVDGQRIWTVKVDGGPDLEGVRAQTASGRHLQDQQRSRSSSTRSATSSGCIWIRRKRRWCSCVDEKSQIQALDRSAPVLPMMPGLPERRTHRLPAPWHHHPVRRPGRGHRPDLRIHPPPAPRQPNSRSS